MKFEKILVFGADPVSTGATVEILDGYFETQFVEYSDAIVETVHSICPDVILFDLNESNKGTWKKRLFLMGDERTAHIPVIVVTSSDDFEFQLELLRSGADDLLIQPIKARELIARVNVQIRRSSRVLKHSTHLRSGDLELNLERLELWIGRKKIKLSVLEFNLLRFFVENFGKVITRGQLIQSVWKKKSVTGRTVDSHMTSLRRKVRSSSVTFCTFYGAGYALRSRKEGEAESLIAK